jgi:KaiC/GvpD/RAD55 family RecA-like ATPase
MRVATNLSGVVVTRPLEILVSRRFIKSYKKATALRLPAEGAIHDLINRYRSEPSRWIQYYDKVAVHTLRILEIDVTGYHRLLAYFENNRLTLLDLGGKSIVPSYKDKSFFLDMKTAVIAPPQFWPESRSKFFSRAPERNVVQYFKEEISPDWIYFLDSQQARIANEIQNKCLDILKDDKAKGVFFVVGGPGTGKTSILLNLFMRLCTEPNMKLNVSFAITSELCRYIDSSTGIALNKYHPNRRGSAIHDVLLIDDPESQYDIESIVNGMEYGDSRIMVMGFDPLQLSQSITDRDFREIIKENNAMEYRINKCYRQKRNVGRATKKAADSIANSSPFFKAEKIRNYRKERSKLTDLANSLRFVNPSGYVETYGDATLSNIKYEVQRINKGKELWQHWAPLLIVIDDNQGTSIPRPWLNEVRTVPHHVCKLSDIPKIKGLEYQHVFIFLGCDLYTKVSEGFEGSSRRVYNERRLLRIPFSRAKDSLVTFVRK